MLDTFAHMYPVHMRTFRTFVHAGARHVLRKYPPRILRPCNDRQLYEGPNCHSTPRFSLQMCLD